MIRINITIIWKEFDFNWTFWKLLIRYQRIRVIGLSQPNLSTLTDESDDQIKDNVSQSDQLVIIRTNSNPNLVDNDDSLEDNTINDKVSHFAILLINLLLRHNLKFS